jgi:hypothetical protein
MREIILRGGFRGLHVPGSGALPPSQPDNAKHLNCLNKPSPAVIFASFELTRKPSAADVFPNEERELWQPT